MQGQATRLDASSPPERQRLMRGKRTRKEPSDLSRSEEAQLAALAALPDDQIDTSDIPEVRNWKGAKRGLFYRPVKQKLTLRIDADAVAWFKERARGNDRYQTNINHALREYMERSRRKAG